MNIFKILSYGDGSINEPNVSAFLAYLLDPNEGHGLGSIFLQKFIHNLVFNSGNQFDKLKLILNDKPRIINLSRRVRDGFNIIINLEKRTYVAVEDKKKIREIDITIEFYRMDGNKVPELLYVICVENKINNTNDNNQLIQEVKGIVDEYKEPLVENESDNENSSNKKANNPIIGMIYLTPDTNKSVTAFKDFTSQLKNSQLEHIPSVHLFWEDTKNNENSDNDIAGRSVFDMLSDILQDENKGLIDPIHDYTKFTIKSFLNFISTDFRSYRPEKVNYYSITDKEYWSLNKGKGDELIDLAQSLIQFACKEYNLNSVYTKSHIRCFSEEFGTFFYIVMSNRNSFILHHSKNKNDRNIKEYIDYFKEINKIDISGKVRIVDENYIFSISEESDIEQIAKPVIEGRMKALTVEGNINQEIL